MTIARHHETPMLLGMAPEVQNRWRMVYAVPVARMGETGRIRRAGPGIAENSPTLNGGYCLRRRHRGKQIIYLRLRLVDRKAAALFSSACLKPLLSLRPADPG